MEKREEGESRGGSLTRQKSFATGHFFLCIITQLNWVDCHWETDPGATVTTKVFVTEKGLPHRSVIPAPDSCSLTSISSAHTAGEVTETKGGCSAHGFSDHATTFRNAISFSTTEKVLLKIPQETSFPFLGPRYLSRLLIAIQLIIVFQIYYRSKLIQIQLWEEDEEISHGDLNKQGPWTEQSLFEVSRVPLCLSSQPITNLFFFKQTNKTNPNPTSLFLCSLLFFSSLPNCWNALLGPVAVLI